MWWFIPTVVTIGVLTYLWLLDREHARTKRIWQELTDEQGKDRS
jgi:hypothetical protein